MSYDIKMRRHVLKVREEEQLSYAKVAERFGIGKQTVYNWTKRIAEKKQRNKRAVKINMDALRADIEKHPDTYQYERAVKFGVSQPGIWHAMKRLQVSYKKNTFSSKIGSRKALYVLPEDTTIQTKRTQSNLRG